MVDIIPNHDLTLTVPSNPKDIVGTRYNPRRSIKAPTKLDLWPHTQKQKQKKMQEIYKSNKKDEKEKESSSSPLFSVDPQMWTSSQNF